MGLIALLTLTAEWRTPHGRTTTLVPPGAVAESVEHGPHMREIVGSNPGRVKPMTYQIDTCHFLAKCSALLG